MKSIYYIITLLVGLMIFNGCETDENGPMPDTFEEGGVAYMVIDDNSSSIILPGQTDDFIIQGSVKGLLFDVIFDKVTLMVAYNGDHENAGILADNITSFPYDFSFGIDDLVAAVPQLSSVDNIDYSDYFTFYANVYIGGKEYPVYQNVGGKEIRTIASGVMKNLSALKGDDVITDITISVPCEYVVNEVTGNYRAVSADWVVDGPVTITVDPDDPYIVYVAGLEAIDGLTEDKGPLKMIIDPIDFSVVAEKTVLASLVTWGAPYHNIAYEGTGTLNTCTGTYQMLYTISVDEGSFGDFAFTLTKK